MVAKKDLKIVLPEMLSFWNQLDDSDRELLLERTSIRT